MEAETPIRREGFAYGFDPSACARCGGACCVGESGYIWMRPAEIEAMAEHLGMEVEDFAKIYLKRVGHRYSLREKLIAPDNYACIMFDEAACRCSVYAVRPSQCRSYPFWDQYRKDDEEVRRECPGIC